MGNDEVKQSTIPNTSVFHRIISSIRLDTKPHSQHTQTFINLALNNKLIKTNSGTIARSFSPFCILKIQEQLTHKIHYAECCLISPIMAIASFNAINSNQNEKIIVLKGINKQGVVSIPIQKVILLHKDKQVCLLVLNKPICQLGWIGISYINNFTEMQQTPLRTITHQLNKDTIQNVNQQKIDTVFANPINPFIGSHKGVIGSIIFKIKNLKPYIIGIQNTSSEIVFCTKDTLELIGRGVKNYLRDEEFQKQILKSINILEYEMLADW